MKESWKFVNCPIKEFQKFLIWKIEKRILTICKINILRFEKLLNVLGVRIFIKNEKINSKIKLSNNSSFVVLIFAILKFWNITRSTFRLSKFWPPLLRNVFVNKIKYLMQPYRSERARSGTLLVFIFSKIYTCRGETAKLARRLNWRTLFSRKWWHLKNENNSIVGILV